MTPTAVAVAALILIPAVGLVSWAWSAMAQVEEALRSLSGFERMHFEIGHQAVDSTGGAR